MGFNVIWVWTADATIDDVIAAGLAQDAGPTDLQEAADTYSMAGVDTASGALILDPALSLSEDLAALDGLSARSAQLVIGDTGHVYRLTWRENGVDRIIHEDQAGLSEDTDPTLIAQADPHGELENEFWSEKFAGYFTALTRADPMSADYLEAGSMRGLQWSGVPGAEPPPAASMRDEPARGEPGDTAPKRRGFGRLFRRR